MNIQIDAAPDLVRLGAYLASDAAPEGALGLSGLDGYLTAVAIGPDLIMPGAWLAHIWDEDGDPHAGPVFESEAEARAILGAILARYNEIVRQIDEGACAPIFTRSPELARDGLEWAGGFLRGVALSADAWGEMLASEQDRVLLDPILGLLNTPEGNPFFDVPAEKADAFHAEMLELAPVAVLAMAHYWREAGPSAPPSPRQSAKIGRNAPCPCGSGRKHKKCCGAV